MGENQGQTADSGKICLDDALFKIGKGILQVLVMIEVIMEIYQINGEFDIIIIGIDTI